MYHTTSKGIAALGRNGDDTLLHVKKDELAGLEALLGPVTTNPKTGLPEAFNWTDILASLGVGIAGALTGGAAVPALGALGGAAVGAGTGALLGGGISAAEGKGFAPGALGGAISGGMGGYGGATMEGGVGSAGTTNVAAQLGGEPIPSGVLPDAAKGAMGLSGDTMSAIRELGGAPPPGPITADMVAANTGTATPDFWTNLGRQGSAMLTQPGVESLAKPVGLGAMLGATAQGTMEQASTGATQLRNQKLQQAKADAEQRQYFASLGFPLPSGTAGTSTDPNQQRDYFGNLIYGKAAGGPIEMSRTVDGVPIHTTVPPKYVSQFENSDVQDNLDPALQNLQGIAQGVQQKLSGQGFATGGYMNTNPFSPQDFYPQSRIASAQPYAAAGNTGVINTLAHGASFAEGGSTYDKGGFLDGPGDGMSDDIPANIDGQEEVRLADGEFVVPPELVSLIGGGDPEEGKRLLDQLLPMVRQAAHGKKEQVKQDAGKLAAEKLLTRKLAKGDAGRSGIEAAG